MNENWKTVDIEYYTCEFREDGNIENEIERYESLEKAKIALNGLREEYQQDIKVIGVLRVTWERLV